ncbi:heparan-alpha-glucosaminide N-acetyltransferase domain-containing protein [Aquimarina algiphila]|uniref:heparan-alpha-glucosaminide N-acetyltransferase domain-containing protein n=1 Tax=Aquimarina algiphila TaxID=2047982 RepID=UPI00249346EB|nr:heparan-alpha-glucosaminide N-acetyltransferase domain-containing protein [Aquimarina algiphila]
MTKQSSRLHFLDAIRAFAIIMMLQGHFVHTLLGDTYRDRNNLIYSIWEYFRGMTAPTFFTITGFIFTYLLLKQNLTGLENPRVLKGIKRAIKVIFWGYLLRLSFYAIFKGTVNPSFFFVDVLQCMGTSLLLLIGMYLLLYRTNTAWFQNTVLGMGIIIFLLQPIYGSCILEFLPKTVANYFTSKNGSVFTLFPWFGYVCFGSFIASLFLKYGKHKVFYPFAITLLFSLGAVLVFYSSSILMLFYDLSGITVFKSVAYNNFLFIRLGNVCMLFSVFILMRNYFTGKIMTKIGGRTLSIYIIHFFVLYGSWFGLGLNSFFYRTLTPLQAFIGALLFVFGICALVLYYYKYEEQLKLRLHYIVDLITKKVIMSLPEILLLLKNDIIRLYRSIRYARR